MKDIVITIDGHAGSGKSTTAALLADRLGLMYLDTGAMYRAVTYAAISRGVDPEDEEKVSEIAETVSIELRESDGVPTGIPKKHATGPTLDACVQTPSTAFNSVNDDDGKYLARGIYVTLENKSRSP